MLCCLAGGGGLPSTGRAWVLDIGTSSTRQLFLQVGVGHADASQWGSNVTTVNQVSLNLSANQLGNHVPHTMSSDSSQTSSAYNGAAICQVPEQVYLGAAYQRADSQTDAAQLLVTAPLTLVNATGETIPFTQLSWSSTTLGGSGSTGLPAGSFSGGMQNLASVTAGTMLETCLTFRYANHLLPAAGTYTGRVVYTLSTP